MTDELEQGGIRHNATDACPSGRPYPHTYDRRCDGDPFDRTRHGTFHGKTHTATEDFGLPTVAALRQQLAEYEQLFDLQHTRTREADERWRAEDPDARANIHPDLGALLTWLMADADNARTQLAKAASDRDKAEAWIAELVGPAFDLIRDVRNQKRGDSTGRLDNHAAKLHAALRCESGDTITERIARTEHERDNLRELVQHLVGALNAVDRARTTLALSAHGLLGALDEGDLDTPGFIERMREALATIETENIRVDLTDKGREILDSPSGRSADGSVLDVAREDSSDPDMVVDVKGSGDSITPSVTHPTRSMHKGNYGVSETDESGEVPESQETGTTERYMMATVAHHQLGDISRPEPNLVLIIGEDGDNWVGSFVEGYGYFNVRFPKATTRGLTDAEVQAYDGSLLDVGASRYVIRIPATGGIIKPGLGTSLIIGETGGCIIPPPGQGSPQ